MSAAAFSYVATLLIGDTRVGWTGDITTDPGVVLREDDVRGLVVDQAVTEYGVGRNQVTVLALTVVKA